jgi:DNA polymerase/3'-5' exonuclease PolX
MDICHVQKPRCVALPGMLAEITTGRHRHSVNHENDMSDGKRWALDDGLRVAIQLMAQLEPYVERMCIVGSVRRKKRDVGDVELLFIPKIEMHRVDMFQEEAVDLCAFRINALVESFYLRKRLNKDGHIAGWGERNKLALFAENLMPVDLFSTTTENWWVSLVIRTGGKDTNLRLTMGANRLGRTLNAYGCGVTDRKTGIVTAATSEREVFELCDVPYLEPVQRT